MQPQGARPVQNKFDDSQWPICWVTWVGEASIEDFDMWFGHLDRWLARGEPFAVVMDTRAAVAPSSRERQHIAQQMRWRHEAIGAQLIMAMVMVSALQRGVLTALDWLMRPPHAQRVFGTLADAQRWCEHELGARRAAPPRVDPNA
jgi:hypothetical protein